VAKAVSNRIVRSSSRFKYSPYISRISRLRNADHEDRNQKVLSESRHAREVAQVAQRAASLEVVVRAGWGSACSTKPLQLADWFSRFVDELDDLSMFGMSLIR
jgi:hypothetical protein